MENPDTKSFHYTYSGKEQAEIQKIRKKYMAPQQQEDKMELLRRLDAGVTKKATLYALTLGVTGALIMGLGMSLILSDFGKILGTNPGTTLLVGMVSGMVGIVLVCLAYPVHNRVLKKQRKKIAPEILRLTDELMK